MKYPASEIDIRVSIMDQDVIVNMIPPQGSLPHCEVLDIGIIPPECAAWITFLERKENERQ